MGTREDEARTNSRSSERMVSYPSRGVLGRESIEDEPESGELERWRMSEGKLDGGGGSADGRAGGRAGTHSRGSKEQPEKANECDREGMGREWDMAEAAGEGGETASRQGGCGIYM